VRSSPPPGVARLNMESMSMKSLVTGGVTTCAERGTRCRRNGAAISRRGIGRRDP
jgi:hypothetical protein